MFGKKLGSVFVMKVSLSVFFLMVILQYFVP